jgi:hypothetical protein
MRKKHGILVDEEDIFSYSEKSQSSKRSIDQAFELGRKVRVFFKI